MSTAPANLHALLLDYQRRARDAARSHSAAATWQGLPCRCGDMDFLLEAARVIEILSQPELTPVPGTPPWVLGLANRHGGLLPVIDLHGFLTGHAAPAAEPATLVAVIGQPDTGLLLQNMHPAQRFPEPEAADSAALTGIPEPLQTYTSSLLRLRSGNRAVLDADLLLPALLEQVRAA